MKLPKKSVIARSQMSENELLPCCPEWRPQLEELRKDSGGGWRVLCYGCMRSTGNGKAKTAADAIAAWNTRPTEGPATVSHTCRAKLNNGPNDPQDCEWPFCECDPHALKVLQAVEESGFTISRPATVSVEGLVEAAEELATYVELCVNRNSSLEGPHGISLYKLAKEVRDALATLSPPTEGK